MSTGKKRLLAYIIMIVSVVVSLRMVKEIYQLWHVDDRLLEAKEELLMAKREQTDLKEQLKDTATFDWKEKKIRDTLKMARPEEVVVIIPEEITTNSVELIEVKPEEEGELGNWQKWWQLFVY